MRAGIKEHILLYRVRVKRDADAFAVLYDEYVQPIYRYIYFKLSNRTDAEDVTSGVFLRAWEYLTSPQAEEIGNFRQFIYTVARHSIVDVYRQRSRRQECSLDEMQEYADPKKGNEALDERQEIQQLMECIKTLKQDYQDVLLLRYIEGLPSKDIAVILGKTQGSVRVTLHRALGKLKELST